MKKVYLFLFLLLLGTLAVQAQTKTWNGPAGGDSLWHNANNWLPTGIPTNTDSVVFTNSVPNGVHFTTANGDANARVINFNGSANVTFSILDGTANTVININLGAVGSNFTNNALRFSGSLLSLTLNTRGTYRTVSPAVAGTTTGNQSGIVLRVLTGNKATITKTIHLSAFATTLPGNDTISAFQVNKIVGIDAGSVLFANGSEVRINQRNNGTNGLQVFNGSATNGVVFQSGSTLTNNTGTVPDPFVTSSGEGTAQFLTGSKFYASNGAAIAFSNTTLSNLFNGRQYGSFFTGSSTAANLVVTNSSTTTTSFLDSLVINPSGDFRATLTGGLTATPKPTFSFKNIYITSRATAAAASSNLTFRSANASPIDSTVYHISGNIDLVSNGTNTVGGGTIAFTIGAGSGGSQSTTANLLFTGNSTIKITKGASGTLVNPNVVMGTGTGVGTNIFINNGATLNLGDSITLRTGSQPTRFTIRPTGRLNLIDAARFITSHNNNFLVESDTTGTGSIGSISSTGSIFQNSVTMQRFIGRNAAWRTIGIPLSTAAPTKIFGGTGTSTSSDIFMNSFFPTGQAYYFNDTLATSNYGVGAGVNGGWRPFVANTDSIFPNKGLLLYGRRSTATPIVLSLTGFINTVDQTIPLSKAAGADGGWNLVANPFLSNIKFSSIISNGANTGVLNSNTIYRVRPLGAGQYSFASYSTTSGIGNNGGSDVIENGAAFFVRAASAGTSLVIRESDKTTDAVGTTTGGVTLMGANENYNSIRVNLKGANTFSDEVVFVWGRFSKATEAFDNDYDAYDLGTSAGTHDLAIVDNEGTRFSIFNGADLPKNAETRTYKLATKNLRLGTYSFEMSMPKALDRNNEAYIVDNYLATSVLVKEGLSHSFQVTADDATKAEGRFQLEIRKKLTSVTDVVAASKTYLLGNPTRNNQIAIHFGQDAQYANWQLVDLSGRVVSTGVFNNVYEGDTRVAELKSLQSGTYLVRLFNGNEPTLVMKFVKL